MENQKKSLIDLKDPKTLVALNLAVATLGMLADDASAGDYYKPCAVGSRGDCEELTSSGTLVCTVGSWWNDCY